MDLLKSQPNQAQLAASRALANDLDRLEPYCVDPQPSEGQAAGDRTAAYFRCAGFSLPNTFQTEALQELRRVGLLVEIIPGRDTISNKQLADYEIGYLSARVYCYGPGHPLGPDLHFILGVELRPPFAHAASLSKAAPLEQEQVFCELVWGEGTSFRRTSDPDLYDQGYSGHDFRAFNLTVAQLRVVHDIVTKLEGFLPPL